MHFKSLVVIAAGLAAFASASPVDNPLATVTLSTSLNADDFLPPEYRPVPTTDPLLKGCTERDLQDIKDFQYGIARYNRDAVYLLNDRYSDSFNPGEMSFESPDRPYKGDRRCQKFYDTRSYYHRMVKGQTVKYQGKLIGPVNPELLSKYS